MLSGQHLEPTFTVAGVVRMARPSDDEVAAGGVPRAELDRRKFAALLETALGLPRDTVAPQSRLSFWRAVAAGAEEGLFRARIAAPAALDVGRRLRALRAAPGDALKLDRVEVEDVSYRFDSASVVRTRLLALLAAHAGQSEALKEQLGQWYFLLWAKDVEFKTHWAAHLVQIYEHIIAEHGRSSETAWSLLSLYVLFSFFVFFF